MLVSQPIEPDLTTVDTQSMAHGEPGLPRRFSWSGATYEVASVLRSWKTTKEDRGDIYVRKHWYEITTTSGQTMTLYCERHIRAGEPRWWLYTLEDLSQNP